MSLDLARIVQGAIAAVPSGLRRTVTFHRVVPGALNTATDTRATDTPQTFVASVSIVTPVAAKGQPVSDDERVLLLAAADASWKPVPGHTVSNVLAADATAKWRVVDCKTTDPNGVAALYEVTVRR